MTKTKSNKQLTIDKLLYICDIYISCIYRIEINKSKKVVWKITSEKIKSHQHFNNKGEFLFIGKSFGEALNKFYTFLKKKKKV